MKTSEPTPGPWSCGVTADGYFDVYQDDGDGYGDAVVAIVGDPRTEANARLVAASPDLLAELEEIVGGWRTRLHDPRLEPLNPWEKERYDYARAAIARARGNDR